MCNSEDDDCDGLPDEDFQCVRRASETGDICETTGHMERVCADDCTWGEWVCVGGGGDCVPGATEPCGNCGTRTCNTSCAWGACSGAGISEDCNDCGSETCLPDGSDWSACRRAHPENCSGAWCNPEGWCELP